MLFICTDSLWKMGRAKTIPSDAAVVSVQINIYRSGLLVQRLSWISLQSKLNCYLPIDEGRSEFMTFPKALVQTECKLSQSELEPSLPFLFSTLSNHYAMHTSTTIEVVSIKHDCYQINQISILNATAICCSSL